MPALLGRYFLARFRSIQQAELKSGRTLPCYNDLLILKSFSGWWVSGSVSELLSRIKDAREARVSGISYCSQSFQNILNMMLMRYKPTPSDLVGSFPGVNTFAAPILLTGAEVGVGGRRRLASQGEPGSIPGGVAPPPGFSQVGIVPDDAVRRRVFSGISRFPRPFSFADGCFYGDAPHDYSESDEPNSRNSGRERNEHEKAGRETWSEPPGGDVTGASSGALGCGRRSAERGAMTSSGGSGALGRARLPPPQWRVRRCGLRTAVPRRRGLLSSFVRVAQWLSLSTRTLPHQYGIPSTLCCRRNDVLGLKEKETRHHEKGKTDLPKEHLPIQMSVLQLLHPPPQSPDVNPVERLWAGLKDVVQFRPPKSRYSNRGFSRKGAKCLGKKLKVGAQQPRGTRQEAVAPVAVGRNTPAVTARNKALPLLARTGSRQEMNQHFRPAAIDSGWPGAIHVPALGRKWCGAQRSLVDRHGSSLTLSSDSLVCHSRSTRLPCDGEGGTDSRLLGSCVTALEMRRQQVVSPWSGAATIWLYQGGREGGGGLQLSSHQDEPGSIPCRVAPQGFRTWESCRSTFLEICSFPRSCNLALRHTHLSSPLQSPDKQAADTPARRLT
ncbi:hypothetical protein PR048_003664 [Dryococelus australis]|uniref:Uncharacterized protein n=1 Tax=Dryococelus australis TaxID=614101 RepID=A0ABQ9INQ8_9NEOP|nr:hypothetical protein PR048_003664 [Dryococelus australis]